MPLLSRTVNNKHLKFDDLKSIVRKSKGFTLIELLVVITILGILAGLTLATFGGTQARGRDSVRKTDLDAIKKTLELMRQDSPGAYYYPECDTLSICELTNDSSSPDISPDYLKEVPLDPTTSTGYTYTTTGCTPGTGCTSYSLTACLENKRDPDKEDPNVVCPVGDTVDYTTSLN